MGHLSISGSKMSKSLKNFTTIREALARGDWNARSLRIIFLLGGWHDGIEITDDMRKGGASWESYVTNFFYKVRDLEVHPNISSNGAEDEKVQKLFEAAKEKVHNALADSSQTTTPQARPGCPMVCHLTLRGTLHAWFASSAWTDRPTHTMAASAGQA
jgi:cysteinyl-tRNA synthetase